MALPSSLCYAEAVKSGMRQLLLIAVLVGSTSLTSQAAPIAARGPAHWADHNGDLPKAPVTAIAVDPVDDLIIYAGLDGFLFKSDDGGDSWFPILSFPRGLADDGTLNDTAVDAFDSQSNGQSIDTGGLPAGSADLIDDLGDDAVDDSDFDAIDDTGSGSGVNDDPIDIVDISVPARSEVGVRAIAFVPNSPGVLFVATPRGIYRTTSGGGTFQQLSIPGSFRENDVRDIAIDPIRPSRLWVGTGSGLYLSIDGGASFSRAPGRIGGVPITDIAVDDAGARTATHILVGSERGLVRSRDGGETFSDLLLRGEDAFPIVHAVSWTSDGDNLYAGTSRGLFVAERGGAILERYPGLADNAVSAISPDRGHTGSMAVAVRGGDGGVVFSDDAGVTVVEVDSLPASNPVALARETKDPSHVWVASNNGVYRLESGSGIVVTRDGLTRLREQFAREPDLGSVTQKALHNHGLFHDDGERITRAGYSALLPRLEASYNFTFGDANQVRNTFIFRDPSTLPPIIDPSQDDRDLFGDGLLIVSPTQQLLHRVFVTLTWDLDRLILNPAALTGARQIPLLRNAEAGIIDRIRELYVGRRRLLAELAMAEPTRSARQTSDRIHKHLKVQELEAQMAALIGTDEFNALADADAPDGERPADRADDGDRPRTRKRLNE